MLHIPCLEEIILNVLADRPESSTRSVVHPISTPLDSDEDLVARISEASARVREMLGLFERVHQPPHQRCQACIATGGRHLEHNCKYYTCQRRFQ
ncbi:hypothetical protein TNCV_3133441 [Trichonephila clavipes]|nr:hypothetical protein TNCV_3133441 [Trichonephila clavipes]